eukprot:97349-Chlamydomonas_euryale.AAC.1
MHAFPGSAPCASAPAHGMLAHAAACARMASRSHRTPINKLHPHSLQVLTGSQHRAAHFHAPNVPPG